MGFISPTIVLRRERGASSAQRLFFGGSVGLQQPNECSSEGAWAHQPNECSSEGAWAHKPNECLRRERGSSAPTNVFGGSVGLHQPNECSSEGRGASAPRMRPLDSEGFSPGPSASSGNQAGYPSIPRPNPASSFWHSNPASSFWHSNPESSFWRSQNLRICLVLLTTRIDPCRKRRTIICGFNR